MKVTVAHLYKKLEELDRDVVELKKLTDRLASDREYSPILKETFLSEMNKLEDQKSEILKLNVSSTESVTKKTAVTSESKSPTPPPAPEPKKSEKPIRKY
ncbi:hypothetical protein ND861_05820 [Leptospira sp. 2 VSF19]|uniref:Uncharacterized protein n=1 Tax=Leptospira soteropolitanensis TaxID=2950025 RepID=A0AAW5VM97_9LEPT|nr:hypothetical protein [Leptospira soteropolitanensis]MCW7492172.1 hypothetical protein [Leptospira soteropolitanensis]MCW7499754.1 hypothetical protein [Leptospira soteropolitanensis]MCW7522005.1 hypothetical protein [Leptospira soteropolitanensis]MCW7525859.1 hypothetical protein [Leptospira soteropolitanensis]MCW7530027.1 hypothetical protein [Leptospira soteropolitanensis]